MSSQLNFFVIVMVATFLYGDLLFCHVNAQDENEDNGGNATVSLLCYNCNATEDCAQKQNTENSTTDECDEGAHCWTWKDEDDGEVVYRRSCGEACTDESKELDCKTSNNRTECALCCDDNVCNGDLLDNAVSRMPGMALYSLLSVALMARLASYTLVATP